MEKDSSALLGLSSGRVLLTWWGSLHGGGPTVGDGMALANLAHRMVLSGISFDIASDLDGDFLPSRPVDWREVPNESYSCLVFVCGPIIGGCAEMRALLFRFNHCAKVAVGVTILPKWSPDYWNPFDCVVARDGMAENHFDLSVARTEVFQSLANGLSRKSKHLTMEACPTVGLCLRGQQREYGLEKCAHVPAKQAFDDVLKNLGGAPTLLDTRLDRQGASISTFFDQLGSCGLIFTTRLHGMLLSLYCGIPCIAIDQIIGSGKLRTLSTRLGWPHVYPVMDVSTNQLTKVVDTLFTSRGEAELRRVRERAIELSTCSLDNASAAVDDALNRTRVCH